MGFNKGRLTIQSSDAGTQLISTDRRIKISYILFVPDANGDQIVIRESSSGDIVFKLSSGTGKQEEFLDFTADPIVMDGVYVDTVSANAVAILYTTTKGGRS